MAERPTRSPCSRRVPSRRELSDACRRRLCMLLGVWALFLFVGSCPATVANPLQSFSTNNSTVTGGAASISLQAPQGADQHLHFQEGIITKAITYPATSLTNPSLFVVVPKVSDGPDLRLQNVVIRSFQVQAFFTTPATYTCTSGSSCLSLISECPASTLHADGTSSCYFDAVLSTGSGWYVTVSTTTTVGTTSHYHIWGSTTLGPYAPSSWSDYCGSSDESLRVRVFCFSSRCEYTMAFGAQWASTECGMQWLPTGSSTCSSSCKLSTSVMCYYSTYRIAAPSASICQAAIGAYTGSGTTPCAIGTVCLSPTSVCQGSSSSPSCVNVCLGYSCGSYGTCGLRGSSPSCTCSNCYTGSQCTNPPSSYNWQPSDWSDCDCTSQTQTRSLLCKATGGCLVSDGYCATPSGLNTSQTCQCSSSESSTSFLHTLVGTIVIIAAPVGGGLLLLIIVCCCCCKKSGRDSSSKKEISLTTISSTTSSIPSSSSHQRTASVPSKPRSPAVGVGGGGAGAGAGRGHSSSTNARRPYAGRSSVSMDRPGMDDDAKYNRDQMMGVAKDVAATIGKEVAEEIGHNYIDSRIPDGDGMMNAAQDLNDRLEHRIHDMQSRAIDRNFQGSANVAMHMMQNYTEQLQAQNRANLDNLMNMAYNGNDAYGGGNYGYGGAGGGGGNDAYGGGNFAYGGGNFGGY